MKALTETELPPPPWTEAVRAALSSAHAQDHLPHALLIHEAPGSGGEWLALWCAQLVLCAQRGAAPCGSCQGCRRVGARQHPDLIWIGPEENSRQLRIEQVRDLGEALALTSHAGGYKVGILTPGGPAQPLRRQCAAEDARGAAGAHAADPRGDPALQAAGDDSQPLPAGAGAERPSRAQSARLAPAARRAGRRGMRCWMRSARRRSSPCDVGPAGDRRRSAPRRAARWRPLAVAAPIRWPRPSAGSARNCPLRCGALRIGSRNASVRHCGADGFLTEMRAAPYLPQGHSGLEYTGALRAG